MIKQLTLSTLEMPAMMRAKEDESFIVRVIMGQERLAEVWQTRNDNESRDRVKIRAMRRTSTEH